MNAIFLLMISSHALLFPQVIHWLLSVMISFKAVSQNIRSGRLRAFAFARLES
ncbi:hypothetical protein D0Y65_013122 [Glycine soja]|uniref:Uncharacterized protein n=1 Tax=Glycine soja TaxID=3848 RepID=A0A445KTA6_GLYSO|nr:hypothetical protein JHK87_013684 [Glycine soja]RZC13901.1 hypothetical protein D0Y65_013122 [Glycine soja]